MSIKHYFDKGFSLKHLKNQSEDSIREDLESTRYVDAYVQRRDRFFPNVDFATASNFANFGSAEEYYVKGIERIYKTYPYDGSRAEKLEWENDSNYVDVYIYENEYPRTNGYVNINSPFSFTATRLGDGTTNIFSSSAPNYVFIKGGPHADPNGDTKSPAAAGPKQKKTSKANIYDTATQRTNNLELDPAKGITVEYWCNKTAWAATAGDVHENVSEYFFHAGNTGSSGTSYGSYGIYANGNNAGTINVAYISGSTILSASLSSGVTQLADSNWHHHAVTMKKVSGKSIDFDGVDDYITVGQPTNLNFDPDDASFTFSAWIRTTSTGTIMGIADDGAGADSQCRMYVATNGKLAGVVGGGDSSVSDAVVNDGEWHHCVLVSNATTDVNILYVDGVAQVDAGACGATLKPGIDFLIGARRDDGSNSKTGFHFKGAIDEVTVWNNAFGAAQVSELYNSGNYFNPKNHSLVANLVSWWEMGDGVGGTSKTDTILDSAGSNLGVMRNSEAPYGVVSDSNFTNYVEFELYLDGEFKSMKAVGASSIGAIGGTIVGAIGGLATELSASSAVGNISAGLYAGKGWGNILSSSFDEFRYWKTRRTGKQIGLYYNDQVGGGTNSDNIKYNDTDYLIDLGVYYKFNEGIVGSASIDQAVLDYSGRISNGTIVNYKSETSRNTGSAIVLSNAATKEYKDPIIYSSHPSVVALVEAKRVTGSVHDHQNTTSLYRSLPAWISEGDEENSGHLKQLTQVMASYFDELFLQIKSLPEIKDINYPYDTNFEKALPFADRLLNTRGMEAPELFADANALAKFLDRDEKTLFEKKLYEVKNTIYQNIYNNLTYIQKSKGTSKSIRNLLRCFGVDEELIRVNVYPKNETYEFKDNVTHTAVRKKYADFDDPETRMDTELGYSGAYTATVYQYYNATDANSLSYIPAMAATVADSPDHSGFSATVEAEVIFPKRSLKNDLNSEIFPGTEVSLFGLHLVETSNTNLNWLADDGVGFQVQAIKSHDNKRNVKFKLVGGSDIADMETSSSFKGVYDNEKWNFAVRVRPTSYGLVDKVVPPGDTGYKLELYGVNYISDVLRDEFTISQSITEAAAIKFFENAKRIYVGAHRTNFTGDVITRSDVKISSVRVWYDYLEDDVIKAHARNAASFGRKNPYKNTLLNAATIGDIDTNQDGNQTLWDVRIPEIKTLLLHWDFTNVTGSDASGQFLVNDISSGSVDDRNKERFGTYSDFNTYLYPARGDKFVVSTSDAIDLEFVPTAKQRLPEIANSDDMVKILNQQDDVMFVRDTTYVQHLISVEKSMYQVISDKMINMFGSIVSFNNLVGDPVNRYRPSYKQLEKLRSIFFEGVENEPDLDKFVEYFKWIDDAVTFFVFQLIPASANKVEFLRNIVESHILERNKHFHKFPTIELDNPQPFEQFKGINELLYNWKFGHAPPESNLLAHQNKHCLWWKDRAERSGILTSGDANIDANKEIILKTSITEVSGNDTLTLSYGDNPGKTKYSASYFYDRALSQPVHLDSEIIKTFKGGPNSTTQRKYDFYKGVVKHSSDNDFIWLDRDHEVQKAICIDEIKPDHFPVNKKERIVKAFTMTSDEARKKYDSQNPDGGPSSNADGTGRDDYRFTDSKSSQLLPFNMYSASSNDAVVSKDYNAAYDVYFSSSTEFTNYHHDIYRPSFEVPMQGPFANQHVGGNQHRHVYLNEYGVTAGTWEQTVVNLDNRMSRPEAWDLSLEHSNPEAAANILVFDIPFTEKYNMPPEMSGSANTTAGIETGITPSGDDPAPEDRFADVNIHVKLGGAETGWNLNQSGPSSADAGPAGGFSNDKYYAVAAPQPAQNDLGKIWGLRTPMVDLLDADFTEVGIDKAYLEFKYHMYVPAALGGGRLSVEYSYYADFSDGGTELTTIWDYGGNNQTSDVSTPAINTINNTHDEPWLTARTSLESLVKTRFFLRFVYLSPLHHAADCALDALKVIIPTQRLGYGSIRVLHPTHDDHNRPSMVYTREEFAKRPVNIRNIQVGSLSPAVTSSANGGTNHPMANIINPLEHFGGIKPATKAGNYINRYEYVNTFSREVNDPYFVKNEGNIYETSDDNDISMEPSGTFQQEIASMYLTSLDLAGNALGHQRPMVSFGTECRLTQFAANGTTLGPVHGKNYKLPDRTDLNTWKYRVFVGDEPVQHQKNKTRFINRFSSPGDILDSSRGFYTTPHEVFAAHNALPWRNHYIREHHKSMLTAHCGRFGVSSQTQVAGYELLDTEFDGTDQNLSTAMARITIKDNSKIPAGDAAQIYIFDGGGNMKTFKFIAGANDFTGPTAYSVNIAGNSSDTLDNLRLAIAAAFSTGSSGGCAGYYDEFLSKAGYSQTINVAMDYSMDNDGVDNQLVLLQGIPGSVGNQPIVSAISTTALVISGFTGGKNATSRVYETTTMGAASGDRVGAVNKLSYRVSKIHVDDNSFNDADDFQYVLSADSVHRASIHKRHRNRGDKLVSGKDADLSLAIKSTRGGGVGFGSQYDNEHVSHTIPRTNDQVKWIKQMEEVDQAHLEQVDPNSHTAESIKNLLNEGTPVPYMGIDQSGTQVGG